MEDIDLGKAEHHDEFLDGLQGVELPGDVQHETSVRVSGGVSDGDFLDPVRVGQDVPKGGQSPLNAEIVIGFELDLAC